MSKSALQAIKAFCKECQNGKTEAITACRDAGCSFYPYRDGKPLPKGNHRPTGAIKTYCHENCQAGAGREEVKNCQGDKAVLGPCPVFPFRFGRSPNIRQATLEAKREVGKKRAAQGELFPCKTP